MANTSLMSHHGAALNIKLLESLGEGGGTYVPVPSTLDMTLLVTNNVTDSGCH